MRKRHFLVCILVLIMAFLLVGCSGNNEPAAEIDNKTADNTAAEENSDQDQAALRHQWKECGKSL